MLLSPVKPCTSTPASPPTLGQGASCELSLAQSMVNLKADYTCLLCLRRMFSEVLDMKDLLWLQTFTG